MQLREILRIKGKLLVTIAPDDMVSDGVSIMSEKDIGSLVVMSQGSLVGMLTFREVLQALSANGLRYPIPQYGIQADVRAGMGASYPSRNK